MEASAEEKYTEKLDGLESKLTAIQTKLTDLQSKKGDGSKLLASPEVTKAIEDFQKQQAALRAERRQIRYALSEGINGLESKLLWINLLATPILVCLFGLWFWNARKR